MNTHEGHNPASLHNGGVVAQRDLDWLFAIAKALGTDSGFQVPIVPDERAFRELFVAVRERAVQEALLRASIATDTQSDAEPLL